MSNDPSPSSASWTDDAESYLRIAGGLCDVSRLRTKDGWYWQLAAWALAIISFGRLPRRLFLQDYASVLGPIHAYPRQWDCLPRPLIVHEVRHTRQFLFAGWFVPILGWLGKRSRVWAGMLPVGLVYILFPLPMFFAWGRFRLELDADSYSWRVSLDRGWMTAESVQARARQLGEAISSWAYLKAWPRSWAIAACERRAENVIRDWQRRHAAELARYFPP